MSKGILCLYLTEVFKPGSGLAYVELHGNYVLNCVCGFRLM